MEDVVEHGWLELNQGTRNLVQTNVSLFIRLYTARTDVVDVVLVDVFYFTTLTASLVDKIQSGHWGRRGSSCSCSTTRLPRLAEEEQGKKQQQMALTCCKRSVRVITVAAYF